jgi:hypothetical protein
MPAVVSPKDQLIHALLELHRELLGIARAEYEVTNGPIGGAGAFLQLLTQDEAFAWLRPLSMLIVELDDPEVLAKVGGPRVLGEAAFKPGNAFSDRYGPVLAATPSLAAAHGEAMRALKALPTNDALTV